MQGMRRVVRTGRAVYASCRCGTGRSFDAKIVKLRWYILWPSNIGEFEDGTDWTNRRSIF